jgi:hypothetical protein
MSWRSSFPPPGADRSELVLGNLARPAAIMARFARRRTSYDRLIDYVMMRTASDKKMTAIQQRLADDHKGFRCRGASPPGDPPARCRTGTAGPRGN